uniref:RNA guanine-7 methyltransferase activating subunit n=1 Tax=Lepisosteus oculatus TaxID=7918 RepID=W5N5M8_LEPOC
MLKFRMSGASESVPNYEEQFAHRFTIEDKEYQECLQRGPDPPPIVEGWRGRGGGPPRGRDSRPHDYRSYRGRERGRSWTGDNRDGQAWQNRGWGHSHQHYQQQEQYSSYGHQGYNSYNQRPHNRY